MAHPHASYVISIEELAKISGEELARTLQRGQSYEINGVRYQSHNLKDLLAIRASLVEERDAATNTLIRQETFLRGRRG
jgi:hypothetical protein